MRRPPRHLVARTAHASSDCGLAPVEAALLVWLHLLAQPIVHHEHVEADLLVWLYLLAQPIVRHEHVELLRASCEARLPIEGSVQRQTTSLWERRLAFIPSWYR